MKVRQEELVDANDTMLSTCMSASEWDIFILGFSLKLLLFPA
jgi:hypothetical protein